MFFLKESGTVLNMFQFSDNTFPLYCLRVRRRPP